MVAEYVVYIHDETYLLVDCKMVQARADFVLVLFTM